MFKDYGMVEHYEIIKNIQDYIVILKVSLMSLCRKLDDNKVKKQIITQSFSVIEEIEDLSIPYKNFYYSEEDISGNKVNSYYGYIACPAHIHEKVISSVEEINIIKSTIDLEIKKLRALFKTNPPNFQEIISKIDYEGSINIKELTRKIVLIKSNNSPIKKISFQPEIFKKGKGRCLTVSEIKYVIENYYEGMEGKYKQDLQLLNQLNPKELLSPISAERKKCRVNIKTEDDFFKNKYCSIPIIILSELDSDFKTNIDIVFERQIRKVRNDQQLEDKPFLAFRSFTRKKKGFKIFLTDEELTERKDYLENDFL